MAEETKSILLQVKIDEGQTQKKIVALSKELENNKRVQAELQKEMKKGGVITTEMAERQTLLKQEYSNLSTEVKAAQRILDNKAKIDKAAIGSNNELKASIIALTADYDNLTREERENAEIGGKLAAQIKDMSDELKASKKAIGDNRLEVGNYTEGILEAVDGTGLIATITGKATQAQAAYTATLNITKASLAGNISMLKAFKLALAATGIGAVLLLLGGLISFLTNTQEGLDKVSQYTKGFTTVLAFLTDKLSAVGKATFEWFSDIKDAGDLFTKLGNIIAENLLNRVKAFGVILEAIQKRDFTKLQDGIFQLGTGVTEITKKSKEATKEMRDVAEAAAAIEKETQRIRDAEIALGKERSKSRADIKAFKLIADDTTKSEKERIDAAQKALGLEQALLDKQMKLQQQKVANITAEQDLTLNKTKENRQLAEEEAKLDDLRGESMEKQIELNNKLNSLRKEGAAKRAEASKQQDEKEYAALQKKLADEKAALEVRLLQTKEGSEERLQAEIKLAQKEMEIALSAKELTENQKKLIRAKFDASELQARKDHAEKLLEIAKKQADDFKALKEKEFQESQRLTDEHYDKETLQSTQRYANQEISAQEHQQRLNALRIQELENALQNAKDYGQSTVAIEQQIADLKIETRQREADTKKAIAEVEFQTAITMVQATADLATIIGATSSQVADFQKAITLFQLGIDTAKAISAITASATVVAANIAAASGPAGIVTGPAAYASYYATNVAAVLANIAQAKQLLSEKAPKTPGFSEGGYTGDGAKHEPAGIVHKGEYVLTKRMVQGNPELISQLEKMRLKGYATGGMVASLPPATRNHLAGSTPQVIDYKQLAQEIGKVNIYTKVTDVSQAQNRQAAKARIVNQ